MCGGGKKTDKQTDRQTDIATWRMNPPTGPIQWKYMYLVSYMFFALAPDLAGSAPAAGGPGVASPLHGTCTLKIFFLKKNNKRCLHQ